MGSRKIVTARRCPRDPARAYPAIRDGWRQTRVNKVAERNRDAPDFVEVGEAGIAVDDAMRRQPRVQLVG